MRILLEGKSIQNYPVNAPSNLKAVHTLPCTYLMYLYNHSKSIKFIISYFLYFSWKKYVVINIFILFQFYHCCFYHVQRRMIIF